MTTPRVALDGPCTEWFGNAWHARLRENSDNRSVWAVVVPTADVDRSISEAASARMVGRNGPGILPLLGVDEVGGHPAWLYEPVEAIGLNHFSGPAESSLMPSRAATELVASVADTLATLGPDALRHPGPRPEDILLSSDGALFIAGFAGPGLQSYSADDPEADLVRRLGLLLATLLTGRVHENTTDPGANDLVIRRVLVAAIARPGALLPESYRGLISRMLAWDDLERPDLPELATSLRKQALAMRESDLRTWAAESVGPRMRRARTPHAIRREGDPLDEASLGDELPTEMIGAEELAAIRSIGLRGDLPPTPDHTHESSRTRRPNSRTPSGMPVTVGPPAEAAKIPRLPSDFLTAEETPLAPPERFDSVQSMAPMVLALGFVAVASVFLLCIGALAVWYLV
jgi:hypothetical protein